MDGLAKAGRRSQQVASLIMQAYPIKDIAKELKMKPRTVKAHLNRLYLRYGIHSGIKRVRLAVLLYREQQKPETNWQQP